VRTEKEIKEYDPATFIREAGYRLTYGNIMMIEEYQRWILGQIERRPSNANQNSRSDK
jgi:hypothetical protein